MLKKAMLTSFVLILFQWQVPLSGKKHVTRVTTANKEAYVRLALQYRLQEFDTQTQWVSKIWLL